LTGSHPLAGTRAKLNTSNERKNYEVLVKIFNTILDCAGQHYGYHSTLKFIEYDKTTTDRADGQGALKPDAAGIHREITPTTRYPWCDIHVVVEIKGVWREGLKQAATYGRSMLQQGRRWYSLVITYNHVKQTLRFCFFTRIGLFTTPALSLTTLEGFRAIARGLLGLAYSTRHDAGIDEHHLVRGGSSYIFLPTSNGKGRWWKVSDLLCQRICIRGRATHVYCALALPDWPQDDAGSSQDITAVTQGLVELNISFKPYPIPERAITVHGVRKGRVTRSTTGSLPALRDNTNPPVTASYPKKPQTSTNIKSSKKLKLSPMQASPEASPANPTSKSVELSEFDRAILEELPAIGPDVNWPKLSADWTDPVVLKESWPLLERAMIETEMFQAVQGRHGIPDVVGAVSYPRMMDMFTGLMDLKVCDDFLEVYSDSKIPLELERRALVRMICSTRGMSVMGIANNPQRLVKALIDSMIGKFLQTYLADDFHSGCRSFAAVFGRIPSPGRNNRECLGAA